MQKGGGKHNPENGEGDARVVEPTPRAHTGTTGSTTFRDALEAPVEKETDGKWEPSEVGCASRHMPQLGSNLDFLHRCMPSPLPNTEGHTGTAPKTFVWEWDVQGNCALRVRLTQTTTHAIPCGMHGPLGASVGVPQNKKQDQCRGCHPTMWRSGTGERHLNSRWRSSTVHTAAAAQPPVGSPLGGPSPKNPHHKMRDNTMRNTVLGWC